MKFAAPGFGRKVLPPAAVAAGVPAVARPLVFTNGVFDVLHCGHVTCLAQARALVAVIAALESVDYVTWFEEDTPLALIEAIRPDILVKGGDWGVEKIVGSDLVLARGGRVFSIPFEHERSTTTLLQRIRSSK